jgi:hypothetical protein
MKYYKHILILIFISATGLIYSQPADSFEIETKTSTVKQDSSFKDSAKVDESYHLIAYVGGGITSPETAIFNKLELEPIAIVGLEIPLNKENNTLLALEFGYGFYSYRYLNGLIKFNFLSSEHTYLTFHVGGGLGGPAGIQIPFGFSCTYKLNKVLQLTTTYSGNFLFFLSPTFTLNIKYRI